MVSAAGGRTTLGQEALRSTLAIDRVTTPPQNEPVLLPTEAPPHFGPVRFALGAYTEVEFNDNINVSEVNPLSDTLVRAGVNLGLIWTASPGSELRFGAGLGYLFYAKNPIYNGLEVSPDSALTWDVSFPDGKITFYDQFSYDRRVITESALSDTFTFPRLDNTVGARIEWTPGSEVFQAGYGHDTFRTTSSAYQYLNRSSEYFFARAGWRFAENTQAGAEASASFTQYDLPIQSDNYSVSAGPYANWQILPALRASIRGGWTHFHFENMPPPTARSAFDPYYFGLSVTHQLTDFLFHSLSITRDVRQGVIQGSDYVQQTTANYSVRWALTQHIALDATLTYEHGDQPLPETVLIFVPTPDGYIPRPSTITRIETFNRYGAAAHVSWRIRDKLSASVGYILWQRDSNLAGMGYTQNSVSLRLDYSF
jgi:hypothetical protein